jgi:GNAT-family acetyltransferase (TIGR03103 family)
MRSDDERLSLADSPSLRNWEKPPEPVAAQMAANVTVDMGWGKLIFGHTFDSNEKLARILCSEPPGQRHIAMYLRDPHVVLSLAPNELFLDPSHTYRLWRSDYERRETPVPGVTVNPLGTLQDAREVNRIYNARQMVSCDAEFMLQHYTDDLRLYLVAQTEHDGAVVGTVAGVDHVAAFNDPENGSSLWSLAVDPQTAAPGVGEALVRGLCEYYFDRGRGYVDLSVLHDNDQAIMLYEKLGFRRVPAFCVKRKNPINESLFIAPAPDVEFNIYAKIIIDEARRRGIGLEVIDAELGFFKLVLGGRSVTCRESLTELATAIAMSRCDDKRMTHRTLKAAGLQVPDQIEAGTPETNAAFLEKHGRVVVKPARGEQGRGVLVDIRTTHELEKAIEAALLTCPDVIVEELVEGQDLRVIVIDHQVVAAAVRRPPQITGSGRHSVTKLIEKYNRRREAATGGESRVPVDHETERCVGAAGFEMDTVLPAGEVLTVRKTANLHTGGTIHDVTPQLHATLAEASVAASLALEIPVVGLDLAVPSVESSEYAIIEANERPGLANHEPQPTAERFIDLLFPQTAAPR